jgi:DNA-binding transcriptional LysR family regulator
MGYLIKAGVEAYINFAYGPPMSDRTDAVPFELRSLEIFLTVCEAGGMAAAARRLGMTQPAVSLAVGELERRTGTTLFDRSVRPIALTPAGGMLRQRASALLAEAREIPPLLRETKHGKVPRLRVGLVDSLSRALTRPIAVFLASRADEVSVLSGLTAMHASELLTRRLDLFLGVEDLQDLPGLERWELITEPYVLLLAAGARPLRTVNDLKKFAQEVPLIRYSARSQTGREIERHLRRLGLELPRSFEFDTPYGVAAMVAAGGGFAITTPLCVAEAMMPQGSLTTARLPGPQFRRKLTLVARHRELGRIPRDLASAARHVLMETGVGNAISAGLMEPQLA